MVKVVKYWGMNNHVGIPGKGIEGEREEKMLDGLSWRASKEGDDADDDDDFR